MTSVRCEILAKLVLLAAALLGWQLAINAHAMPVVDPTPNDQPIGLSKQVEYILDESFKLALKDVTNINAKDWQTSQSDSINFGYTNAAVWLRLRILKPQSNQPLLLELPYPNMDWVDVYFLYDDQLLEEYHTGDGYPYEIRPRQHRYFLFPIHFNGQQHVDLYMRLNTSGSIQIPLYLWQEQQFYAYDNSVSHGQGLYYGIMLVMIFYNLFLFISIREKVYLLYILYVISVLGFQTSVHGINYQHLWPSSPQIHDISIPFFIGAAMLTICLFTSEFLALKQQAPKFALLIRALAILSLMQLLCSLFFGYSFVIKFGVLTVFLVTPICLLAGIHLARKGSSTARFFSLSWLALLLGAFLMALNKTGVIPVNFITENSLQLGSALEVVLLSIALASRINTLKEEQIYLRRSELEHKAKQMEAEKLALKANAENKAKSEFLTKISHEIRTPMNGILGMAQLMNGSPLSEEQRKYNEVILSSGQTLLTIIDDILDYSRIESGRIDIKNAPFQIDELLAETLGIFAIDSKHNSVELFSVTTNDVPKLVFGDKVRIKQILVNLIGNAFKFTHQGHIMVAVDYFDPNNHLIRFTVSDSGSGIDECQQPYIFQSFTQADNKIARKHGGTGLGLAISKQLAELMSGEIGFSSNRDAGATFWFTVKLESGDELHSARPLLNQAAPVPASTGENNGAIFLFQNQILNQQLHQHAPNFDIRIMAIKNAEELSRYILHVKEKSIIPDVICIDANLEDLQRLSLCKKIRNSSTLKSVAIILVTSAGQKPDQTLLQQYNIEHIYLKPIHIGSFLAFIQTIKARSTHGPECLGAPL